MNTPLEKPSRFQMLQPHGFDASTGTWKARPGLRPPLADRLTLVTYNLWFNKHRWQERSDALLRLVRNCDPDIIGFQEVTPPHLERILAEDWVRREYHVSDVVGFTLEPHGVLLLSRLPVNSLALSHLPSHKDRKLVVGELATADGAICVGTVHLESSALSFAVRLEQLYRILPSMRGARHAVLMGDFNFDPRDQAEQSRIDPGYTDLWPALHSGEPGYTVDSALNGMRLLHKQRHTRARFDRILLRSAGPRWEPESIRMIGTQPISPDRPQVYPSDHFGLVGVISRRQGAGRG